MFRLFIESCKIQTFTLQIRSLVEQYSIIKLLLVAFDAPSTYADKNDYFRINEKHHILRRSGSSPTVFTEINASLKFIYNYQ